MFTEVTPRPHTPGWWDAVAEGLRSRLGVTASEVDTLIDKTGVFLIYAAPSKSVAAWRNPDATWSGWHPHFGTGPVSLEGWLGELRRLVTTEAVVNFFHLEYLRCRSTVK